MPTPKQEKLAKELVPYWSMTALTAREPQKVFDLRYKLSRIPESKYQRVYLMKSLGLYKIGITRVNRQETLQIGNPFPIELVWQSDLLPNANQLERALHKKFQAKRIRGEWFALDTAEINWIIGELR